MTFENENSKAIFQKKAHYLLFSLAPLFLREKSTDDFVFCGQNYLQGFVNIWSGK
jgi:hypothetical protein